MTGPGRYRVDVDGLIVTMEASSVLPSASASPMQGVRIQPRPRKGDRLMWISLVVKNSTEDTIPVRASHNYPSIRDSRGRAVPILFPRGMRGSPYGVPPRGVVMTVAPYDVPPGGGVYTLTWTLSPDRVAVIGFTWP